MLGQTTFGWIDEHCKQATGYNDKILRGKSLILIGVPGQLPPLADKQLYHSKPSNEVGEQGYQTCCTECLTKLSSLLLCNQRVQGLQNRNSSEICSLDFVKVIQQMKTGSCC